MSVPPRPSRPPGRPRAVEPDEAAQAVVAVGFAELSPAAVAEHLGVHVASLYRNVGGLDALVDAALGWLVRTAPWPRVADVLADEELGRSEPGDEPWRRLLRASAHTAYALMIGHPGLTLAAASRAFVNADLLALMGRMVDDLESLGWEVRPAAAACDFVLDLTYDTVRDRDQLAVRSATSPEAVRAWSELLDERLVDVFLEAAGPGADAWFDQKLDLALAGIAARLAPPT